MTSTVEIEPINIEDEIQNSYLDYAMSVIVGRALPDVRDGLKPVHRRILYAQHELGNRYNTAYKKSARIVGDVIGKYHPHGDSAVYDALVRLAQDFNMRVPLVDGQGNFGSVDGDPAAAMRYTEVRMARVTQELLNDLEKDTVDWGPNYDGTLQEPLVLPANVPNLLVNGSTGIAVGMATNIPPHNLGEVVDATVALIEDPELDLDGLMEHIPGPDFPTGGTIYGVRGLRDAYETGRGIIRVRARAFIETNESNGKARIIVDEIPFQVNKSRLIEKIAALVKEKKLDGITDLRDESDRQGMRIVVELRRDVVPEVMLNNLYKTTQMQSSFGIIMLAIVHGQPRVMPLKEVLNHFIDFRRDVVTRRTLYELEQAEARAHILEGYKVALDHIDEVIALIRSSRDGVVARLSLSERFGLSERQSQAILDMRLQRLTGLEYDKVVEELEAISLEIERLRGILAEEGKLMQVIKEELLGVRDQYTTPRRTEISTSTSELSIEDLIAEEPMVVTISHAGYIKRTPVADYRAQQRGGRGRRGMATKEEDFVKDMFIASTHAHVLFFTSIGKVYRLKVHELPPGSRATKGKAVVNLLPIAEGETVKSVLPVDEFTEGRYVLTATRNGVIKKTDLMAYAKVLSVGIIALSLKADDELVEVRTTSGEDCVFLVSQRGYGILFDEQDVRSMGRTAAGVYGMKLSPGDRLVSMTIIPRELARERGATEPEEEEEEELFEGDELEESLEGSEEELDEVEDGALPKMLAVTQYGYGKRTRMAQFSIQNRNGKGVITIKTNARNGSVVGATLVEDDDELLCVTNQGQIIRMPIDGISVIGRNTQGVRLMTMDEGEEIVSIAKLVPEDEELEDDEELEGGEEE